MAELFNKKNMELKEKYKDINYQSLEVQERFEESNKKLFLKNLNKEKKRKNKDIEIKEKLQRALSEKKMMMHNEDQEIAQKISLSLNNLQKQRELFNQKCKKKFAYVDYKLNNLKLRIASYNEEQKLKDFLKLEKFNYNINKVAIDDQRKKSNYIAKHKKFDERKIQVEREKESQTHERQLNSQENEEVMRVLINEAEMEKLNWRKKVKDKIEKRAKSTDRIMHNKQLREQEKIDDNNEKRIIKDDYIKQVMLKDDRKREIKREKWENRIKQVDEFLKEKHNIEHEQIAANDDYNNQKTYYNDQINDIIGNKYFNKNTLNSIQEVLDTNPNLSGLVQNLNKE